MIQKQWQCIGSLYDYALKFENSVLDLITLFELFGLFVRKNVRENIIPAQISQCQEPFPHMFVKDQPKRIFVIKGLYTSGTLLIGSIQKGLYSIVT